MEYDVFISYSKGDRAIAEQALARIEAEGLRCWIAPRNIGAGTNWPIEISKGIERSRLFVLIFSASSDASEHVQREVTLALDAKKFILPLRIENIPPGGLKYGLANCQWVDAAGESPENCCDKLISELKIILENQTAANMGAVARPNAATVITSPQKKVAISYKRHSKADEYLLKILEPHLTALGYKVFIDRHVAIGMQWASEIGEQIKSSYALVILLSENSVQSEMVHFEAQVAHDEARLHNGRPHILPVRVQYNGDLPEPLHGILATRQYFMWSGESEDQRLLDELAAALQAPVRAPVAVGKLEAVGGAVPVDSRFYVERRVDGEFREAIDRRDSIVCIKGARQMGKTSLLARGMKQVRSAAVKTVFTDLQALNTDELSSAKAFYIAVADLLADKLEIEKSLADIWNEDRGANRNFELYMKKQVLPSVDGHLLWAIDEVDRLFTCSFGPDTFGLFRTWHNAREADETAPWSKLTLAIAYATEAHLFITNINQSPFNVGTRLEVEEFTLDQVADLNRRHGTLLSEGTEVAAFFKLVRGHPFLVRRGLDEIARRNLTLAQFEDRADKEDGPYSDHLRRILVMLAPDAEMTAALTEVLKGSKNLSPEAFYRLRSAGLVEGESAVDARPRCVLYERYLRRHLLKSESGL